MKKHLLAFVLLAGSSFGVRPLYAADQTTESKVAVAQKEQEGVQNTLGNKKISLCAKGTYYTGRKKCPL